MEVLTNAAATDGNRFGHKLMLVLMISMTVLVLLAGTWALYYAEVRQVQAAGESLSLAAAEIAEKLDRLLFQCRREVMFFSDTFALRVNDVPFMDRHLKNAKKNNPLYLWLAVTDAQGIVRVATDDKTVGTDYSKTDWFILSKQQGTIQIGDVQPLRRGRR